MLIGVGAIGFVIGQYNAIEQVRIEVPDQRDFTINNGDTLKSVVNRLPKNEQFSDFSFKLWLKINPQYARIQAGHYELKNNETLANTLERFVKGDVKQFSITLIEGQTLKQWLNTLNSRADIINSSLDSAQLYETLIAIDDFCKNDYKSLEGCLLPDTYFYTKSSSALAILKRAYLAMAKTLNSSWQQRAVNLPYNTAYDALILSSIVEKETAISSERGTVAGVFVNRLRKNMRLQTDPTVIYGIGESFNGDITRRDLRTKTPYNTYVIKGLPITPIAMPSIASIYATMQPQDTQALYFVASGDGGHVFSTTLEEHNEAVRRYLQKTNN